MAEEKVVTLKINSNIDDISDGVKVLNKQIGSLSDNVTDFGKESKKSNDKLADGIEKSEKATKSLSEGFKGTGLALKAMGVGLIVEGFTLLKEVFMSNQKVADAFGAVLGTVKNIFSQVTDVIVSVIEKVSSATNGFDGLSNVIGGLLKIALTPLKLSFYAIRLAISELNLAWEESLFGDGDPKKIKDLNNRIDETKQSIVTTGQEAIKAGMQVANNIGKAINEVGQVVSGTIDGVSKISIASAYEQAKAQIQLQNTSKLAEATQARLVEQYDRQAEKLRQVRDEERNSIEDRIKANNNLGKVLEAQQKAMLAQADAQIASAKATLSQNKNIENQAALINSLANREGVLAQIEGLRSEQKVNDLALNKELIDLTKSQKQGESELAINQALFTAERLKDDELKLKSQKKNLEAQKQIELERLQFSIDSAKKGTQARVDAENEFALKKQEIDNAILLKQDEIDALKITKEQDALNKKSEANLLIANNEKNDFEIRLAAIQAREDAENGIIFKSQEEKTAYEKANADARLKIAQEEAAGKIQLAQAASDSLGLLSEIAGKQTAAGKALAIAQALINTYLGISQGVKLGFPAAIPAVLAATVTGFKAVKNIMAVQVPQGGGGGASMAGASGASVTPVSAAPQFNVVGTSGSLANQVQAITKPQQPIKAYVVSKDVTSAQSLDRNIIKTASIA